MLCATHTFQNCKQRSLWSLHNAFIFLYGLCWHDTSHYMHINNMRKVNFLTALKSSKSLSSLSVPRAAIRCWWCILAKSRGPTNMETNGETDRQGRIGGQNDRWRYRGRERREESREVEDLGFFCAPLRSRVTFPPQRNKSSVKQPQTRRSQKI